MVAIGEGWREEGVEVRVGVGDGVAEVDDISIVVEFVFEGEVEIGIFWGLSSEFVVFFVVDFGAVSDPADLSSFVPHHWKDGGFHSVIE